MEIIILMPILPNPPGSLDLQMPDLPKRLDLTMPNSTYIFCEKTIMTYILGGYLFDLWTCVGLCSLHRFLMFS